MLYTLLKDERIVTGPRDWNAKYFEYFLSQDCEIETSLQESPIVEPLIFNEHVKLVPTIQEASPDVNPQFEVLAGPNFKYDDNGNHVSYYVAQELQVETAKTNLRTIVADKRWNKEVTPINRNINEKNITIYTDRESRNSYTQTLLAVGDEYLAQWKFPEGFVALSKADLHAINLAITMYVQECFDWEVQKVNEINSTSTIEELKQIVLE